MNCLQADAVRMGQRAYNDYVNYYSEDENYRNLTEIYSSVLK